MHVLARAAAARHEAPMERSLANGRRGITKPAQAGSLSHKVAQTSIDVNCVRSAAANARALDRSGPAPAVPPKPRQGGALVGCTAGRLSCVQRTALDGGTYGNGWGPHGTLRAM